MRVLSPYVACFRAGANDALADRSGIATMLLIYVTLVVVFQSIFRIFPVHELGIAGLTWTQLLWYFAVTETIIVSILGNERILANRIADSGLSSTLTRPGSIIGLITAQALGTIIVNIGALIIMASVLLPLLTGTAPPLQLAEIPAFIISVLLGAVIFLLIGYCVSTIEVHGPYSRPLSWILNKLIFTFGGLFFPVVFFPAWLQNILSFTPFPSTIGAPANFMLLSDMEKLMSGIFQQIFWVFVMLGIALFFQHRMVQKVLRDGD